MGEYFPKFHNIQRTSTCWWACAIQSQETVDGDGGGYSFSVPKQCTHVNRIHWSSSRTNIPGIKFGLLYCNWRELNSLNLWPHIRKWNGNIVIRTQFGVHFTSFKFLPSPQKRCKEKCMKSSMVAGRGSTAHAQHIVEGVKESSTWMYFYFHDTSSVYWCFQKSSGNLFGREKLNRVDVVYYFFCDWK